eukprot:NODE_1476_length_613_cov_911.895390_g1061_i0.p1 GENE.NODE_1476_length_613_cov_911.895390_g1061_i0~~NODE_1476_length_613_cov_911.895390_g1061_i0.p1  ORF type:complete len:158 (+),score=48.32 NODE_1476_length_613_cov_911.895390_g1061_i0:30-476(+)
MGIKQENMWYSACPTCSKKVQQRGEGDSSTWRCEKCDVNVTPSYRYILSCTAMDTTGQKWFTAFQETAEALLGISAKDLFEREPQEPGLTQQVCKRACFKQYAFTVRAKKETYADEARMKHVLSKATAIEWASESRTLLEDIKRYSNQ